MSDPMGYFVCANTQFVEPSSAQELIVYSAVLAY
jgi:hypothetical protein